MNATPPSSTLKTAVRRFRILAFVCSEHRTYPRRNPVGLYLSASLPRSRDGKGVSISSWSIQHDLSSWLWRSAISLSGSSELHEGTITHTIRAVRSSYASHGIAASRRHLGIRGPYGSAWPIEQCDDRDVVIVSGGLGWPLATSHLPTPLPEASVSSTGPIAWGTITGFDPLSRRTRIVGKIRNDGPANGRSTRRVLDRPSWRCSLADIDRLHDLHPYNTTVVMCGPEVMMHFSEL